MKKLFCLLVFISCSVVGFGQRDSVFTIEGTIRDSQTDKPIKDAIIFLIKNELKIDSITTNKNGFYKFEFFDRDCYDLLVRKIEGNYFSTSIDKPYCFQKNQNRTRDFHLSKFITEEEMLEYEKKYLIPPLIDTISIQINIKDEQNNIISNVQLNAFYENGDTSIFLINDGELIIDYIRGNDLFLEVTKQGFNTKQQTYFFPAEMDCGNFYIENPITQEEYDRIIDIRDTIGEFQKILFILKK